jgi:malate synthase
MARDLTMNYVRIGSLSVARALHEFIEQEAAPGTSLSAETFWSGFAELLRDCGTRNRQLLQVRDELQSRIDQYHRERSGEPLDLGDYERFLRDIGYVLPEGNDFAIRTTKVDDEIAVIAGPQLVVPLSNARYALNAANARWGSLYDALSRAAFLRNETQRCSRALSRNPGGNARAQTLTGNASIGIHRRAIEDPSGRLHTNWPQWVTSKSVARRTRHRASSR